MKIAKFDEQCTCNECNRSNYNSKYAVKKVDTIYKVEIGIMALHQGFNKLKILRECSGMSQGQFAKYFNIPTQTIQNWEQGRRKCPQYLIDLIEYKLLNEHLIKGFDDFMKHLNNKNNGSGE